MRRSQCQPCRLLAAMKDSGSASTTDSSVPQMAICTVSSAGAIRRGSMLQSGGTERATKSAIWGMPAASSPQLICAPPAPVQHPGDGQGRSRIACPAQGAVGRGAVHCQRSRGSGLQELALVITILLRARWPASTRQAPAPAHAGRQALWPPCPVVCPVLRPALQWAAHGRWPAARLVQRLRRSVKDHAALGQAQHTVAELPRVVHLVQVADHGNAQPAWHHAGTAVRCARSWGPGWPRARRPG